MICFITAFKSPVSPAALGIKNSCALARESSILVVPAGPVGPQRHSAFHLNFFINVARRSASVSGGSSAKRYPLHAKHQLTVFKEEAKVVRTGRQLLPFAL
jgi:hypothetical protein